MSLSAAVGAPAPVVLVGKEYVASPVDAFGIGELEEFARARILAIATKAADDLPRELGDRLLDRALKLATAADFESEQFREYLMSERGMRMMLAISLRARHPGMTPTALATLLKDRAPELVRAIETVLRISGLNPEEQKAGPKLGEGQQGAAAA